MLGHLGDGRRRAQDAAVFRLLQGLEEGQYTESFSDASGAASFTGRGKREASPGGCQRRLLHGRSPRVVGPLQMAKTPATWIFFKERVKFALEIAKNRANTLGFLFDGRSRDCRRAIDAITSKHDYLAELDITFVGKFNKAATRKVFGSQFKPRMLPFGFLSAAHSVQVRESPGAMGVS